MFKSIHAAAKTAKSATLVTGLFVEDLGKSKADAAPGFKAEVGETFVLASGDVLLGLGKKGDLRIETLRTIGARLLKRLDRLGARNVTLVIPSGSIDEFAAGRAVGEGLGLANWRVDFFAGKASSQKPANPPAAFSAISRDFTEGLERGLALAESTNYARRIAVTPPNICTPAWLVGEARKLAKQAGLKLKVIDYAQAKRLGMGGLVNVGMGSVNKPCIIILEHKPARIAPKARNTTLAIVGKTITYDTGGYSLKVNNGMKGMKYDKCGGMATLGAMHAISALDLPVHVYGVLTCAENMVSGDSYRPDDIITMYNGVSVEVTNTDAEGRLVLGDALTYACKDLKATHVVDLATLTGGIVTALGHFCAGVFCNDDALLDRVNAAADSSGDKVWRMPLWKEHKEFMRSPHADILNSNPSRNAHPIQGAAFLAYFVDEKVPWAHLDIAAMGNVEKDTDLFVTGPTGYGVRLVADLVEGFAG